MGVWERQKATANETKAQISTDYPQIDGDHKHLLVCENLRPICVICVNRFVIRLVNGRMVSACCAAEATAGILGARTAARLMHDGCTAQRRAVHQEVWPREKCLDAIDRNRGLSQVTIKCPSSGQRRKVMNSLGTIDRNEVCPKRTGKIASPPPTYSGCAVKRRESSAG